MRLLVDMNLSPLGGVNYLERALKIIVARHPSWLHALNAVGHEAEHWSAVGNARAPDAPYVV
jgi:predicted nuclease of predicted toxin-antitoxin system